MTIPVRRVIAGHDADGKAVILEDRVLPSPPPRGEHGILSTLLWVADKVPADIRTFVDTAKDDRDVPICPPAEGLYFRVIEYPPEGSIDEATRERLRQERAKEGAAQPRIQRSPGNRHHGMHRTESIDFVLVLKGEIDMLVDDGEVHLGEGDVLLQLANNHAWVNRSGKPCLVAFCLIGAKTHWA